ncbi:MAG: hypothetical protein P4L56_29140 [Candidatus Sulfopaludibacter sp.]|nr:hypothetical protein [Candidatus Sulfopaludibacter sp.]
MVRRITVAANYTWLPGRQPRLAARAGHTVTVLREWGGFVAGFGAHHEDAFPIPHFIQMRQRAQWQRR